METREGYRWVIICAPCLDGRHRKCVDRERCQCPAYIEEPTGENWKAT